MAKRFEIWFDGSDASECYRDLDQSRFVLDGETVENAEQMMYWVKAWMWKHHGDVRSDFDPHEQTPTTETVEFHVQIVDTETGEIVTERVWIHPDEPDDADGDWVHMGGINNCDFYKCDSIEDDGDTWWKVVNENHLGETNGIAIVTYTQETPHWFKEEDEEEEQEEEDAELARPLHHRAMDGYCGECAFDEYDM